MDRSNFEHRIKEKLQSFTADASSALWWRLFWRMNKTAITGSSILLIVSIIGGSILISSLKDEENPTSSVSAQENMPESESDRNQKPEIEFLQTRFTSEESIHKKAASPPVQKEMQIENSEEKHAIHSLPFTKRTKSQPGVLTVSTDSREEYIMKRISAIPSKINTFTNIHIQPRQADNIHWDYYTLPEKRPNRLGLSIEAGPAYVWHKFSGEEGFSKLLASRRNNESSMLNISPGIRFTYRSNNLSFRTGLDYSTYGEKLNYHINHEVYDPASSYYRQDTIWGYIYNYPYVEPVAIGYDSTWVEVFRKEEEIHTNKNLYRYLEIPVMIGYVFESNKLKIMPHSGISIGMLHQAKGKIPSGYREGFKSIDEKEGLNKVIISFSVEMDIAYELKPKHSIFLKPFYRSVLSDIVYEYPVNMRYKKAGIKFGYTIHF